MLLAKSIILLIIGLVLVVYGADFIVDGASSIARKSGLSEFVIGLTIVGIGTSMPEMVVSFLGAIHGNGDIAIGNVVGSNMFNVLLILALTALISPLVITRSNIRRDIPINLAATLLLILIGKRRSLFSVGSDNLGRAAGAVFLLLFALYLYTAFKNDKDESALEEGAPAKLLSIPVSILMVVGGMAGLVFGGNLFVNSATDLARMMGASDKFIAITLLAGGTSMPELATCVVAAAKKRGRLALGNILGSNVSNIFLILGGSALISPLSTASMNWVDLGVLTLSALILLIAPFAGKKKSLDRGEAVFMLIIEAAYFTWLVTTL